MAYSKPIDILLVESNAADARLMAEALKASASSKIRVVSDGYAALARLCGADVDTALPGIILLDLKPAQEDGRMLLETIKADPQLQHIPVVVITASQADEEIARGYSVQANSYIARPVDEREFARVLRSISSFWFGVVKLPGNSFQEAHPMQVPRRTLQEN